jgi:hypothetical protein
LVFKDELLNLPEFMNWNAPISGQCDIGFKPELAFAIWSSDMDVRRFLTFIRVEVEPKWPIRRTVGIFEGYPVSG